MNEKRREKLWTVASRRQADITVVLENVYDQHNIGAVLRSCDSVGIKEIFILQTDPNLKTTRVALGKRTSAGTRKWVDVHYYTDAQKCFEHLRNHYEKIYSTHLAADSKSLYNLDLSASVGLLFGNEQFGVSEEVLALTDGNFIIPQVGMASSLNISVACAVSVYEAFRQRNEKGFYTDQLSLSPEAQKALFEDYAERHRTQFMPRKAYRKD